MIAISYRREDSLPITGRLYDRLQAKFGKANVFMDFDSIPPGVDFREQIKKTIERSNLVIAVIGPHWLGEQSDSSRRIDDPTDFVRLEIEYALKSGIPVIPLLVNNTPMPKPGKLPTEIEALAFRNALPLDTGIDFHNHADRLINGISEIIPAGGTEVGARVGGVLDPKRPERSTILVWGIPAFTILAGLALFALFRASERSTTIDRDQQAGATKTPIAQSTEIASAPPVSTSAPTASIQPSVSQEAVRVVEGSPTSASVPTSPIVVLQPAALEKRGDNGRLGRVYVAKVGLEVLLPTELFPDAALQLSDANSDRIESTKGCATVRFSVSREPVKTTYDAYLREFTARANGKTIDYKVLKPQWFVVSGSSQTTGFYTKGVKHGEDVAVMELEYTGSTCNIPATALAEISRTFDGNGSSDDEHDIGPTASAIPSSRETRLGTEPSKDERLFAGTWKGTMNAGKQGSYPLRLTVNEAETQVVMTYPETPLMEGPPADGWSHQGPRKLLWKYNPSESFALGADDKTATFSDGASRGVFHKQSTSTATPSSAKRPRFAGKWSGVEHVQPAGAAKYDVNCTLEVNAAETSVTVNGHVHPIIKRGNMWILFQHSFRPDIPEKTWGETLSFNLDDPEGKAMHSTGTYFVGPQRSGTSYGLYRRLK